MKHRYFSVLILFLISYCDCSSQEEDYYWYKYQYTNQMKSEKVLDMEVDHLGYIWVMTTSNLYFLNEQGFRRASKFARTDSSYIRFVGTLHHLKAETKADSDLIPIYSEIEDGVTIRNTGIDQQYQWEFSADHKLYKISGSERESVQIAPEFQMINHPITFDKKAKLILDPSGGIWLFGENGLLLYKKEKRIFEAKSVPNIIKQITAVRSDPENNQTIYLTSYSGVIIQDESGQTIKQIPIPEKYRRLPAYDWFFIEDRVIIWAGFGVFELNLESYQMELIFDPKYIEEKKIEQTFCSFVTLSPDSTYLVLGTKGNLFYNYDLQTKELLTYEIEPGIEDNSNLLFELDFISDNKAIIVTMKGIYLFDKVKNAVEKMPNLQEKLIRAGAEKIQDLDIYKDSLVYFATREKGIFIYHMHHDSIYEPINNIKDIMKLTNFVVDDEGDAWFGSSKGILHYRRHINRLSLYNTKNGLYTDDFLTNFCHFDQDKVFFGHNLKYISFDPKKLREDYDAKIHVQFFFANNNPIRSADPIIGSASFELEYANNNISMAIGGPNYGTTQQYQVESRMLGLDDKWSLSTDPENIQFLALLPGKYTFQYKPLGQPDAAAKEISINILHPFWTRTWVRYSAIGLGIILLACLYFYNIWTIKKRAFLQAEYERKIARIQMDALRARMNPHFIFNSLNSIKSFIIENDSRSAARYLTKFAHLIRQILNNSKEAMIPLHDELKSLELYIEIEKLRFNESFTYEIRNETKNVHDELKIPSMILQPFVENAIWHGLLHKKGEKNIVITIKDNDGYITTTIEDNGIGRAKAEEMKSKTTIRDKSLGTDITSQRLSLVDNGGRSGTVKIIDLYNEANDPSGTLVILKVPISPINPEDGSN